MSPSSVLTGGEVFVEHLAALGVSVMVDAGVVRFSLEAMVGGGVQVIESGVAVSELQAWPAVPPHWVHFPGEIAFSTTNRSDAETLPGWARHSRDIRNWGNAQDPAQAWIAHVRSVLLDAQ